MICGPLSISGGEMNKNMFSLRLSHEILEWLNFIASKTQRSRASVIRWLIQEAYFELAFGQNHQTEDQSLQAKAGEGTKENNRIARIGSVRN